MRCYNCKNSKMMKLEKDFSCIKMPQCRMEDFKRYEINQNFKIKVGDRIRFKGEKHFWKVRARDTRFLICTWRHFYTICDLRECIRGKDNYIDAAYDYIDCLEIELREALYRLNMKEPKLLKDCENLDDDIRYKWYKEINCFAQVPENQQWVENIEISYRNFVELDIEEVK